ncbi:MAG: hypothetical protein R2717_07795 [Schumannella sp.]
MRVTRVLCRGGSGVPGFDGLDSINLLGDLSNGGQIALNQSFSSREPLHDLLVVVGRAGTLLFSGYRSLALDGRSIYSADRAPCSRGLPCPAGRLRDGGTGRASPRAAARTVDGCLAVIEAASRSCVPVRSRPSDEPPPCSR